MELIPKSFYLKDDVVSIAQELVGKIIQTTIDGQLTSGYIVETEAYRGADDKGCHAFIHGVTDRTKVMFEEGGIAYVYICYGMHNMVNVVTNTKDKGDAVLIRAIEPISGLNEMKGRRGNEYNKYHLSGGPGKVCQCLGITKTLNGQPFYNGKSRINIFNDGKSYLNIVSTPRVGMSKNVSDYANKPWRFYVANNPFVSRPLTLKYNY